MPDHTSPQLAELPFLIGDYRVDPAANSLKKGENQTSITPKMMAVLCFLASSKGTTLSREKILDAVWGEVSTSDDVLSRAIADLRKVLHDSAKAPRYIETVSKKGYRFIANVELAEAQQVIPFHNQRIKRIKWVGSLLILILTLAGGMMIKNGLSEKSQPFLTDVRPLTFDDFKQRAPRFNQDGTWLVYTYESDEQMDIYLKSLADNQEIRLTHSPQVEERPIFSADGKQILFRRYDYHACRFVVLNIASKKENTLASCPSSQTQSFDWSPNQKYIVATQFDKNLNSEGLVKLELISGETFSIVTPQIQNTGYLFPRISPSGRLLSFAEFSASTNHWSVMVYDLENAKFVYQQPVLAQVNQVAWGKTDSQLYYAADDNYRPGLWSIDLSTQQVSYLFHGDIVDMDFDRKNSQFAISRRQFDSNVWQIADDGSRMQSLINPPTQERDVAVSPDGKSLAYISDRNGRLSLWVRTIENGRDELLFQPEKGYASQPSWANDGNSLFVQLLMPTTSRLIEVSLDGAFHDLFSTNRNTFAVARSTSEGGLIWSELVGKQWQTFYRASTDNVAQKILDTAVSKIAAYESGFYYSLPGSVYLYHLEKQGEEFVSIKIPDVYLTSPKSWEIATDGIFLLSWSRANQPPKLVFYNFANRSIKQIANLQENNNPINASLTVNPKTKMIYFSSINRSSQDLELISLH